MKKQIIISLSAMLLSVSAISMKSNNENSTQQVVEQNDINSPENQI